MLSHLSKHFLLLDLKTYYTSYKSIIAQIIGAFLSLSIYYYTSKAFGDSFKDLGVSYFVFVLVGELSLYLASTMFDFPLKTVKQWKSRGIFDYFLTTKISIFNLIVLRSICTIPRIFIQILLQIILAVSFFNLDISFTDVVVIMIFPLFSLPIFISLGFVALSIFLFTGRGNSVLGYISTGLSVLAGAYFPLSVLPGWLQRVGISTPFAQLLEGIRLFIQTNEFSHLFVNTLSLLTWNILGIVLSWFLFQKAIRFYKENHNRYTYDL